eukprot:c6041_g1_i1 orf=171-578(+)
MAVVVIDGSTVRDFVQDEEAFNKAMDQRFQEVDVNHDNVLSRSELRTAFESMRLIESHLGMPAKKTKDELNALYDSVFEKFDTDQNGKIDPLEFRDQMRAILLAVADGLGAAPLYLVMEEGSFLQDAVDHEASRS